MVIGRFSSSLAVIDWRLYFLAVSVFQHVPPWVCLNMAAASSKSASEELLVRWNHTSVQSIQYIIPHQSLPYTLPISCVTLWEVDIIKEHELGFVIIICYTFLIVTSTLNTHLFPQKDGRVDRERLYSKKRQRSWRLQTLTGMIAAFPLTTLCRNEDYSFRAIWFPLANLTLV